MRRREFVVALGATVVPFAARAQRSTPVIGMLRSTSLSPFEGLGLALREGLKEVGFIEGQNVAIEVPLCREPPRAIACARTRTDRPRRICDCRQQRVRPRRQIGNEHHTHRLHRRYRPCEGRLCSQSEIGPAKT